MQNPQTPVNQIQTDVPAVPPPIHIPVPPPNTPPPTARRDTPPPVRKKTKKTSTGGKKKLKRSSKKRAGYGNDFYKDISEFDVYKKDFYDDISNVRKQIPKYVEPVHKIKIMESVQQLVKNSYDRSKTSDCELQKELYKADLDAARKKLENLKV